MLFRIRKFQFLGKTYRVVCANRKSANEGTIVVRLVEEGQETDQYLVLEVTEFESFEPTLNWTF